MKANAGLTPPSKAMTWAGRILTGITILFMLFDSAGKLAKESHVLKAQIDLGWPDDLTVPLGVVLLVCTILYAIPRTAVLGAILLTAWLGGATAAKVRLEDSSMFFSVLFGIFVWGGIFFRDERVRELLPFRRSTKNEEA
jgi:hypothetical protein